MERWGGTQAAIQCAVGTLHQCTHYKQYHECCKQGNIKEAKSATPKSVLAVRQAANMKEKKKQSKQLMLNGVVCKIKTPTAFSHPAIHDAVAKHITVRDQVQFATPLHCTST